MGLWKFGVEWRNRSAGNRIAECVWAIVCTEFGCLTRGLVLVPPDITRSFIQPPHDCGGC